MARGSASQGSIIMFAHDKLEVINNALMKIGLPLAASLEDCDWNAATVYDLVVEQILRSLDRKSVV